jgi:hypothetical protein
MNHVASPDRCHGLQQLWKERSIENDLVPGHMNNNDAERQRFEIVLMLKSAIGGDEYITLQLPDQHMVFPMLPAEIEEGLDLMIRERFDQPRIDASVYDDAHSS